MRKTREVLRLAFGSGPSQRKIARSLSISSSTVCEMVYRAKAAGLGLETLNALDDKQLDSLIYPSASGRPKKEPLDFKYIRSELRRKGVTLLLLRYEYKQANPDGYQYSQFCERYRQWQKRVDPVMRQNYRAGEKMFVDYAGQKMQWIDPNTGEVNEVSVFVAVLGASNYAYAEVQASQKLECWIEAHCRAFEFFEGVTEVLIPDNTKTGVSRACYYEPDLNPTYLDLALHYGTAAVPARPRKPRDKAKVEAGVQAVERELMAPLRNVRFFSLDEIQVALRAQLHKLNERPFRKMEGSRRSLYESVDKPALKLLPSGRYEIAEWRKAKVNIDYHVEVDRNMYSVPYKLLREQVDVRLTARTVEVLHNGKRVASHKRCHARGVFNTDPAHMPVSHAKQHEWSPSRILNWASGVGPQCTALCEQILATKEHQEQGYRACLGVMKMAKRFGADRVEAACLRAMRIGAVSFKSVRSILETSLDRVPLVEPEPAAIGSQHCNIRGEQYYQEELIASARPAYAGKASQDEA